MPIDKSSLFRFLLIDTRLRQEPKPTLEQLKICVEQQLKEATDEKVAVSRLTIKRDIKNMRKFYLAPIKFLFEKNYYHYASPGNTFLRLPADTIQRLLCSIKIQYLLGSKFNDESKIRFEVKNKTPGWKLVPLVVKALFKKRVITFVYKSPGSKRTRQYRLHPYLLEEISGTCFLFGRREKGKNVQAFDLNRVIGIPLITDIEAVIDNKFYATKFPDNKNENPIKNK